MINEPEKIKCPSCKKYTSKILLKKLAKEYERGLEYLCVCSHEWGGTETIIDQIEKIRAENNKNWMNLLRIALKYAPEEAKETFNKITNCDVKINKLMKEINNE